MGRGDFEGMSLPQHVWRHCVMSCADTAEPVEMSFGLSARVVWRKHVLHWEQHWCHLANLYILNTVRCPYVRSYIHNGGRGQLSSEWRHNESDIMMRTGAASAAVGHYGATARDVIMRMTSQWQQLAYIDMANGNVATGCTILVWLKHPCTAAMRPCVILLWQLVLFCVLVSLGLLPHAWFCYIRFVFFFNTNLSDWLGSTSPK